jgi:hypothetical protein
MIAALIGWVQAIFAYLLSGARIQGEAYLIYGDDRD